MKRLRLSLLLMIPALVLAKPKVIVFPLSPYFEFGKTNTFLVSIKNYGTNSIPIPSGLRMDNGIILPKTAPSITCCFIELTNGIPHMPGLAGAIHSDPNIDIDLITQALEKSTKDEVWDQLHGKHYLKPLETITYKINWVCDPQHPGFETLHAAMVRVELEFIDCDIEAPSTSLFQKQKSNQKPDPTVETPVESGKEQGTAGHP